MMERLETSTVGRTEKQVVSADGRSRQNPVASAVSRLFCLVPNGDVQASQDLDIRDTMSISVSPASYDECIASRLAEMPETDTPQLEEILVETQEVEAPVQPIKIVTHRHCPGEAPELPFDLTAKILGLCDTKELQAAHGVSRDWRNAARVNLKQLAPSSLNAERIASFPMVECLHIEYQNIRRHELANMKSMKSLGLKHCTFKHPISDLSHMQDLQRLKLKDINFWEPDGLDACRLIPQLTSLTHLEMSRCSEMLYCMPNVQFKTLQNLQGLVINDAGLGTRLTHLTQLSELHKLKEVTISKSIVDFDIARSIGTLTQLERLELPDASLFNNASLMAFSELINLTRLDLRTVPDGRSEMRDGISVLANMKKLQYLNLAGNVSLAEENLRVISGLQDLKCLNMSGINVGEYGAGFGPNFLADLTGLTNLNLCGTVMKGTQFGFLQHLSMLRVLDTSHTFLDSSCCHHIAAMKDLQTLKINYCPVRNDGMHKLMAGCPNLSYLRTDGCWISTLGMLSAMAKRPEIIYWSKGEMKVEVMPRPIWYRKLEQMISVRIQPDHMSLRSFWVKESSWTLSVLVAITVLLVYASWMGVWLFLLVILTFLPVVGAIAFGFFVAPVLFFSRILKGRHGKALQALPDAYHWLYDKIFGLKPRTADDRLAELV